MRLSQLYNRALKIGMEYDPRGKRYLSRQFKGSNPYADSQILYGDGDRRVKNILIGIDIEVAELLLADQLRQRRGLDLVISHHPQGRALLGLFKVMHLHIQMLKNAGVSEDLASGLLEQRRQEVDRKLLGSNHTRAVDVARLLDMPFICLHTVADNLACYHIQKLIQKKSPGSLQDILKLLDEIPEYRLAKRETAGPRIILGRPHRPTGKILVEMTGGTEGPKDVFGKLYNAGVRTLICMHLSEEHFKKVKDTNLNVIIAGHISSDNLGLNLLLDKIEKEENFNIIECSGFRRVSRKRI